MEYSSIRRRWPQNPRGHRLWGNCLRQARELPSPGVAGTPTRACHHVQLEAVAARGQRDSPLAAEAARRDRLALRRRVRNSRNRPKGSGSCPAPKVASRPCSLDDGTPVRCETGSMPIFRLWPPLPSDSASHPALQRHTEIIRSAISASSPALLPIGLAFR